MDDGIEIIFMPVTKTLAVYATENFWRALRKAGNDVLIIEAHAAYYYISHNNLVTFHL